MVRKQQPPIQPPEKETPKTDAFSPLSEQEMEDRFAAMDAETEDDTRPRAPRRDSTVLKNGHMVWATNDVRYEGNLGQDPELSITSNAGVAVTRISLAVYQGKDKDPVWIRALCWDKLADEVERNYRKGDRLRIYGHLTQRKWTSRDGRPMTTDEVVFDACEYVEPRR